MLPDTAKGSAGVTLTEELLFGLCTKSFLRMWSYANPFKEDGDECCDVLVLFENHALIFFDREKQFTLPDTAEHFTVAWQRWKRTAIDAQFRTAHGAERYLRSGRPLFLDAKCERPFPLTLDPDKLIVHKIVVAHGVAEACKAFSDANITGSLAIAYGAKDDPQQPFDWPFMISIDRERPIHVLDSHSLPILLGELDTIRDFTEYLDAKATAIARLDGLIYCGEEDLLAHYLLNLGADLKHFIGSTDSSFNLVMIEEGTWQDLLARPQYVATKDANRSSYMWDEIIDRTCNNFLQGRLLGDSDLFGQRSAILEMAREPRFMRRALVDLMMGAVQNFPAIRTEPNRFMRYLPSIDHPARGYVFLQLWIPEPMRTTEEEDRGKRQNILATACAAAKSKMPELQTVVGIGIEPPKLTSSIAEDFVLLDCSEWSGEQKAEFEARNVGWNFFATDSLRQYQETVTEFVQPTPAPKKSRKRKPGRNEPCPCGSGKKYKRCHGS